MSRNFRQRTLNILTIVVMLVGIFSASFAMAQITDTAIEFVGSIEALSLTSITVNGQIITISGAEITVPLQIAALVKVEGTLQADGSIIARQVKAATDATGNPAHPGETEIIGLLTDIQGGMIVVGGQIFDATQAEVKAGVALGQMVKLHASFNGTLWLVREIEPATAATAQTDATSASNGANNSNDNVVDDNGNDNSSVIGQDEVELVGTLQQIGADFIVVSGQQISVSGAEIKSALVVGAQVKVHLSTSNGQAIAREVELAVTSSKGSNGADDNNAVVNATCPPTQPAGWSVYTIQSGDTLSGIAKASGSNVNQLVAVNCLANPNSIVVGASLFVPQAISSASSFNSSHSGGSDDNLNGNSNDDNGNSNLDDHGTDNGQANGNDNSNSNNNNDDHGGNSGKGGSGGNGGGGSNDGSGHN